MSLCDVEDAVEECDPKGMNPNSVKVELSLLPAYPMNDLQDFLHGCSLTQGPRLEEISRVVEHPDLQLERLANVNLCFYNLLDAAIVRMDQSARYRWTNFSP